MSSSATDLETILADIANRFDVAKNRVCATVKLAIIGPEFGNDWMMRPYVARPITAEEAREFRLPPNTTVLSLEGEEAPKFMVYPSTYPDENRNERQTVCAAAYAKFKAASP